MNFLVAMHSPKKDFSEFRRNSGILFTSFVGMMFGIAAIPFYTLGVFAGPVTQDTGWTMQQFQFAFTFILFGTFFGPVIGHYCDRFGSRWVAILSIAAFAISLILLGLVGKTSLWVFYVGWAFMAVAGQGTSPVIWTHIVGRHFVQHRGLAFGIVLAGSGVFAAFGPKLASFAIGSVGWQNSYIFFGLIVLLAPLPLAVIFLPSKGQSTEPSLHAETGIVSAGIASGKTLGQALMDYRFYVIGLSFLTIAFGVAGLISNMLPMLKTSGISMQDGVSLIGLIGIAVIGGRIFMGALLDRFWAPLVAAMVLLTPALACLLLIGGVSKGEAAIAVLLVGFAAGAEFDIVAYLASKYFGLLAYGKIYGVLYITLFAGAAIAPPVFGAIFDRDGSYESLLHIMAILFPIAAFSLLTLGRYPDREIR